MKNALILHGMPGEQEYNEAVEPQSEQHWLPWLKTHLEQQGISTHTPEFPLPYKPEYQAWKQVFEEYEINEDTILVGHSCGAGFIDRWLSENRIQVGKVVLVAPWMDPAPTTLTTDFFHFVLDPTIPERTTGITIFVSENDDEDIQESVRLLSDAWPTVKIRRFEDKGHFTLEDMGTREFPELLEEVR